MMQNGRVDIQIQLNVEIPVFLFYQQEFILWIYALFGSVIQMGFFCHPRLILSTKINFALFAFCDKYRLSQGKIIGSVFFFFNLKFSEKFWKSPGIFFSELCGNPVTVIMFVFVKEECFNRFYVFSLVFNLQC